VTALAGGAIGTDLNVPAGRNAARCVVVTVSRVLQRRSATRDRQNEPMSIERPLTTLLAELRTHVVALDRNDVERDPRVVMYFAEVHKTQWVVEGEVPLRPGFALLRDGMLTWQKLVRSLAATPEADRHWGERSIVELAADAAGALISGEQAGQVARATLAKMATVPAQLLTYADLYGVDLESPADLCGVSLRRFDIEAILSEFGSTPGSGFLEGHLRHPIRQRGDTAVLANFAADIERAGTALLDRTALAVLTILGAAGPDSINFFAETTVHIAETSHYEIAGVQNAGSQTIVRSADAHGFRLEVDGGSVRTAISANSALAAVETFALGLPRPLTSALDRRFLRCARHMLAALSGPIEDRYLHRWMAIEAMLGERGEEVTERITDRLAVLTCDDPAERADRKKWLKHLYRWRSDLAHGGEPPNFNETDLSEFRQTAIVASVRFATLLSFEGEATAFAHLEQTKFKAQPVVPPEAELVRPE
jgi:hypothetical protein